jgi:hypothetical protein
VPVWEITTQNKCGGVGEKSIKGRRQNW